MKIVLIGPPGSGKGTQAELISKKFHIVRVSIGKLLRDEVERNTAIGKKIKANMGMGKLVPNQISNKMMKKFVAKHQNKFILDGFPRALEQARALDQVSDVDCALLIDTTKKVAIERISGRRSCECGKVFHNIYKPPQRKGYCDKCGRRLIIREDDKPVSVKKRFEIYQRQTRPVIKYYQKKGVLCIIDGTKSIKGIFSQIVKCLKNYDFAKNSGRN